MSMGADSEDDDLVKSRMETIRDFAHEVRTPLTSIVGFTKMISDARERNLEIEKIEEYGEIAHEASIRLVQICERVLEEAISGHEITTKQKVDFRIVADSLLREFSPLAEDRGVSLCVKIADEFPILMTDPLLLSQAVSNLVNNAIKFTPRGGQVDIRGEMDVANNAIILVVQDDGEGMPEWVLSRLMAGDRVSTIKPSKAVKDKGWGRGIQIVRDFASRLGATLEIASEEGKGTVVSLRMPVP